MNLSTIIKTGKLPETTENIQSNAGEHDHYVAIDFIATGSCGEGVVFTFATSEKYVAEEDVTVFDGFLVINDTLLSEGQAFETLCNMFFAN